MSIYKFKQIFDTLILEDITAAGAFGPAAAANSQFGGAFPGAAPSGDPRPMDPASAILGGKKRKKGKKSKFPIARRNQIKM
jgi:hypothetical protein